MQQFTSDVEQLYKKTFTKEEREAFTVITERQRVNNNEVNRKSRLKKKMKKKICKGKLKNGERCKYSAVLEGYCMTHWMAYTKQNHQRAKKCTVEKPKPFK